MQFGLYLNFLFLTACLDKNNEGEQAGDCSDRIDNDNDGNIDCLDSGCLDTPECNNESIDDDDTGEESLTEQGENLFYLDSNETTVKCPNANFGDSGVVNGLTYTKRDIDALRTLIQDDEWIEVERTCTSGITDMSELFSGQPLSYIEDFSPLGNEYTDIVLESWDTSNVTNMSKMFYDAIFSLQDLYYWDTSNVTNMSDMFNGSSNSFYVGILWDVGNVTDMSGMFANTESTDISLSRWDISNVTNMSGMFENSRNFYFDIKDWNVSNVTNMSDMFAYATNFDENIGNWDVSNVTDMSRLFNGAKSFNQDIGAWDVGNVMSMHAMFKGDEQLYLDDTRDSMYFIQDLSNWDVSNVEDMSEMFSRCEYCIFGDLSNWDVSNVTNMYEIFRNTTVIKGIGDWNVSNVTNMDSMFRGAYFPSYSGPYNQYIGDWDVSNVTNMDYMFAKVSASFDQDLSGWCVSYFSSEPDGFSLNDYPYWTEPKPVWGTCP